MKDSAKLKVLFIAGFGPIVRDTGESCKLYRDALGIPFKEEPDGYLHTEAVPGAKSFALWPLSQVAQSCFGKDSWPKETPAPQAWLHPRVYQPTLADWSTLRRQGGLILAGVATWPQLADCPLSARNRMCRIAKSRCAVSLCQC